MDNKKLVLINSPIQKYSYFYRPQYRTTAPLGLGYLGTIARRAGIETTLVDAESQKLTIEEIASHVNSMNPDTVGINMMSTNYEISLEILDNIEASQKIIGGSHATLKGDEIMGQVSNKGNYLVVKGEPEDIFVDLIRKGQTGIINAGRTENLDRLPFIDRTLFDNDPYFENYAFESAMSTARGCPFSCVFCSVPVVHGNKMRTRSIDNVLEEIQELQSQGVNSIHFMDDIFNFSKKRLYNFCNTTIERGMDISWRALTRVELLDDILLERMREAGCYKLSFGIESGVPEILRYIGKCQDTDLVKRTFSRCKDLGIQTKAFFTIGHPPETEDDIRRTIEFSLELDATEAYFMVVRAFPGTRLYEEMQNVGLSERDLSKYHQFQDEDGYVKYHVMNVKSLNGMPETKLDGMVREAYGRFYKKPEVLSLSA